jgi:drug/metabolite transporter (DMT)-like permease
VIAPSTVTILSTLAAGFVLGEALTRAHLAGAALVLAGVVLIGWQGIIDSVPGERAWVGDMLFMLSSILWVGFTLLIRVWRIDAVRATAVVAVLSLGVVVPAYLAYRGLAHLAAVPRSAFVFQALLQGLVQAIITIMAFSRAVAILGVSRAVLFPATVPAISVLIGIPALGEIPNTLQIAGLLVVSIGMLVAVRASAPRRAEGTSDALSSLSLPLAGSRLSFLSLRLVGRVAGRRPVGWGAASMCEVTTPPGASRHPKSELRSSRPQGGGMKWSKWREKAKRR